MDFNTTGHKQRKGGRPGRSGVAGLRGGGGVGGLRGGCGGGGIEGRAGEEDGVHRDPLNKPRVP